MVLSRHVLTEFARNLRLRLCSQHYAIQYLLIIYFFVLFISISILLSLIQRVYDDEEDEDESPSNETKSAPPREDVQTLLKDAFTSKYLFI